MKRIKFKLPSWDEGRALINDIAQRYQIEVNSRVQNLFVENEDFTVNCHLDDREFSFITIKLYKELLENEIRDLVNKYKRN